MHQTVCKSTQILYHIAAFVSSLIGRNVAKCALQSVVQRIKVYYKIVYIEIMRCERVKIRRKTGKTRHFRIDVRILVNAACAVFRIFVERI